MGWTTNNGGNGADAVTVLLAGAPDRTHVWYTALGADARFRVVSYATDPQDVKVKMASNPEIVLLDATIYSGPDALIQALAGVNAAVYVFLPPDVPQEVVEQVGGQSAVKAAFRGDANLVELAGRMYADALALRRQAPAAPQMWGGGRATGGTAVAGLRIITVWNRAGGTGRSTLAAALALDASRKGLRALLVGLGAPDVLPLHLGLNPEPNFTHWMQNPTQDGFQAALQQTGSLDVLAGFPDVLSEARAASLPKDDSASVQSLVTTAAYANYAAIVLDAPVGGVAPFAIAASNTLVLVARATLADAWASVEAYRTVVQRAAGQHRIAAGNVVVVLNMRDGGQLTPDEWHQAADAAAKNLGLSGFPPVAAVIPYVAEVPLAQDQGRPALDASDAFARPVHKLADMLFGGARQATGERGGKAIKLGFIKIRKGK